MPDDFDPWLNPPRLKRAETHEMGQNLDALSVAEIDERIKALNVEIQRLETAKSEKEISAKAAAAIFKI